MRRSVPSSVWGVLRLAGAVLRADARVEEPVGVDHELAGEVVEERAGQAEQRAAGGGVRDERRRVGVPARDRVGAPDAGGVPVGGRLGRERVGGAARGEVGRQREPGEAEFQVPRGRWEDAVLQVDQGLRADDVPLQDVDGAALIHDQTVFGVHLDPLAGYSETRPHLGDGPRAEVHRRRTGRARCGARAGELRRGAVPRAADEQEGGDSGGSGASDPSVRLRGHAHDNPCQGPRTVAGGGGRSDPGVRVRGGIERCRWGTATTVPPQTPEEIPAKGKAGGEVPRGGPLDERGGGESGVGRAGDERCGEEGGGGDPGDSAGEGSGKMSPPDGMFTPDRVSFGRRSCGSGRNEARPRTKYELVRGL